MERTTGNEGNAPKSESEAKARDQRAPAADDAHRTPSKKRRKVNHAHDVRSREAMKSKSLAPSTVQETASQPDLGRSNTVTQNDRAMRPPSFDSAMANGPGQAAKAAFDAAALTGRSNNPLQLVQPTPVSGMAASTLSSLSPFAGFSDAWLASQNHYHDMHNFHPNYVIAPEVTNEFNLLNDFLQTSLLDDGALLGDDQNQADVASGFPSNAMLPPSAVQGNNSMLAPNAEQGKAISRPTSVIPTDKTRAYYLQAADPTGNAAPEERMRQVLQAKYEAGMLKPFNYVKGYTRLQNYLDTHVAASSKQKILRQLDRFRPKFREKMKDLTDMDLVLVEMWFERTLMDYDRVFASMAVPACCWRRTGEIFRGNKEMAELIKVPVEDLRGGKIALHEILTEESNVRYWEEFGTIAFDPAHDTLLTACSLKSPIDGVKHVVNCCFSFRIRRDDHKVQKSLITDTTKHIDKLHVCQQTYVPGLSGDPEIDALATGLWNVYAGEVELAAPVMQLAANHKTWLQTMAKDLPEDEAKECRCLEVEYFIMRTALCWVENRLDVAEHMYTKAEPLSQLLTSEYAERLADVLFEIGKSMSTRGDFSVAVKWFERANEVINGQELEQLSREGLELRLAILQALVTALLGNGTPEGLDKAKKYVDFIEAEAGNKFVVSLLKLELLQKTPAEVFDSEAYGDVLRHIIRNFTCSDSGFKLVMHHVRKLHDKSPGAGCAILDDFILALSRAERDGWMEKAVVTRMWMITNQRDSVETINAAQAILGYLATPLSAEAAVAAQAPMTAYLAFKVAVRVEDRALAEKCLESVAQAPDNVDYLGACIAESQKAGDIMCAIAALKKLQEKYEYNKPNSIHLPALFRCTIRLLTLMADRPGAEISNIVNDLCKEFDAVVLALKLQDEESSSRQKLFTVDELEWFSRNAYNLALKNSAAWELRCVVRMLTACVEIIGRFPSDSGSKADRSLRKLFSHFVVSSALISLARTHDHIEKQRQDYAAMRKHVVAFDQELPEYLPQLDETSREDMLRKHATLLAFDFEAAIALQQWEDLSSIVQRAMPCKNITAFQAMADSLLRAQAPGQVLYSIMRKIVNEIWVLESFDAVKLAKYTRCLFQATLPLDDGLAMRLLDEACSKARELRESQAAWPEEELEWMATTSFNHAIDCYSAHETERAKDWATKAINLAHYCNDGRLEEILQSKYLRLSFDGGSG
ncbi:hypothetical protein NEMBOFW57_010037 [Staphylotrichum longicolle]|uniref:ERT1/acuK family PAS domain-containing protein n=1 Tax=Staphylotrichum longicolle TaxID=669026 RepID=A0AAD4EQJ5_9PEZI|nr:hypothetical protein NEMBOFW57_010037 [Staphylotrichum longicolle]